ncbi:MAG: hypothetical protein ACI88A_000260 [Paraglaciecola sp.]|jgi:hypothetical protein
MAKLFIAIISFMSVAVAAQTTGHDVYIADLAVKNTLLQVSNISALTDRPEYDNQPFFLADGETLLITSAIVAQGQEQTDSFLYQLAGGKPRNITNSEFSEYSPTLMPNGIDISVIKVIGDKQKLWRYALQNDRSEKALPSELLKDVDPVGYHAWIDQTQVMLFVLGEPHSLQLANIETQSSRVIDSNIGPSLYKIPGTDLMSYTATKDEGDNPLWELKSFDPKTQKIAVLSQLPDGAYYYGWSGDGKTIAAQGSVLKQWDFKRPGKDWRTFADLSETCPKGITRLTTNAQNTRIAVVCSR